MTKAEKELLYDMLEKASGSLNGYTTKEFKNRPVFMDDEIKTPYNTKNRLSEISQKIQMCSNCALSSQRKNAVPGEGSSNPYVLVIGEAPGEEEDLSGRPFVGPAGQLLDKMLSSISLSRKVNCFIANTIKCRPPKNRDPRPEEMSACRSFLDAQIALLKPKYILLLGKVSVRNIFSVKDEFSLSQYRQKILEYNKIPVFVTYHPSCLLRNAEYKRPAWEDLKFLRAELKKNFPEYKNGFENGIEGGN